MATGGTVDSAWKHRHTGCEVCSNIEDNPDDIPLPEKKIVCLCVEADLINHKKNSLNKKLPNTKERRKARERFTTELRKCISAIRNGGGGAIIVHMNNLDVQDRYLDLFHELVDEKLNCMIDDGSPFVQTYKKNWLSDEEKFNGLVAISVSPSVNVVTVDFKTKFPLDNSVEDPNTETITKYMISEPGFKNTRAQLRGIALQYFEESRNTQVKVFKPERDQQERLKETDNLSLYIWNDLRLKHYITSLSKVDGGGSFYLGVAEKDKPYQNYTSKEYCVEGFDISEPDQTVLKNRLKELASENILVSLLKENQIPLKGGDIIDVGFYSVQDKSVLEVAVAAVKGIVFYDKEGPESYEVDRGSIRRLQFEEWQKRLLKGKLCQLCEEMCGKSTFGICKNCMNDFKNNPRKSTECGH